MTELLSIDQLTVTIANKTLLEKITFSIQAGDYVCVLGPNGAGKSSLLKAIMGILPASDGTITLNGIAIPDIKQKALAQQISYVPQASGQALSFEVEAFIKMGRYPYHSTFSEWTQTDQDSLEQALTITNTMSFRHRRIETLSGGERQRVMIAAALCQQSPILLLDEPTSFLDPHHQIEVHNLIRTLNTQHHISIIEVSHDLNHACQHSQKILALKEGQILWFGQSDAFLASTQLQQLYQQEFVFTTHPQTGATIALASELS